MDTKIYFIMEVLVIGKVIFKIERGESYFYTLQVKNWQSEG
jgi:hypothetical protein